MARTTTIQISNDLLRTLHRLHRNREDLSQQISRCPRQIAAGEKLVAAARSEVVAAEEALRAARLACNAKQQQLDARESQLEQFRGKLNSAASNKEFALLKDRIAADEQANSVQSDEILEALEVIDGIEAESTRASEQLAEVESQHTARVTEIKAKASELASELERIEAELREEELQLPEATRADYRRLTAAKGVEAIAPIEDDSCGFCYQTLTAQVVNQVLLSRLTHCPNCNAFLYRPESDRVV